ncbi:ShlB/FhaC/HecB family hemolysin secretion/activation protein [Chromobacterium alticapitis]|nr:ShlB/FhaC/HecB family hemolysin secretion/activation protein [Chromobacterium alticapitis]
MAAGFALAAIPAAWAQTLPAPSAVPDAGQTLRELQRSATPESKSSASLRAPAEAGEAADNGLRFPVRRVRIEGAVHIPAAELQALVDTLIGPQMGLNDLRGGAHRITALYRERGYLLARAYLPAQELQDGIVTIQVLEGQFGKSLVRNGSKLPTALLEATLNAQLPAEGIVRSAQTDRALLLLADLPGAGPVNGSLRPGDRVGSSDLAVQVEPGKAVEGEFSADNYGNRYSGQERMNGRAAFNSPLGLGDRLELRATYTSEKLAYGRMAYDAPLGRDGLRLGGAFSISHYDLGQEFASLEATGSARTATLYGSYPLLRSLARNVWLAGNVEHRNLRDDIGATLTDSKKSADVSTIEAYGDWVDGFLGGGYGSWRVSILAGELHIDSDIARLVDGMGPRTEGAYQKYNFSLSRTQRLPLNNELAISLTSQMANKNLDSSEKFVLGGAYGVRAYPQGEGTGDEGWLGNIELRHAILPGLQAAIFADQGHVQFSHSAYAAGANGQTLRGYGLSLGASTGGFSAKASVAWRDGAAAASAPDHRPRLWLLAEYRL